MRTCVRAYDFFFLLEVSAHVPCQLATGGEMGWKGDYLCLLDTVFGCVAISLVWCTATGATCHDGSGRWIDRSFAETMLT